MSSLATAPQRATPEPAEATPRRRTPRFGVTVDAALAALLAAAFSGVVFVATYGADLGPNTWVEIILLAAGAAGVVALVLAGARPGPRSVGATIALFAALAALTYLSIAWSVQPATSWVEANRTLSYLAAFVVAVAAARLAPRRWPVVLGAVAMASVVVCGYGLLAKVFPASLDANDLLGRLHVPLGYWNAIGLMAALGLPACLWAGTRTATGRVLRALSVPGLAVLITTLMLSYSRGAVLAAVVGLAVWFVFVPLRLRGALLLGLGVSGGAVGTLWALAHHAITHDNATLAARTSAGHDFGVVLLVLMIVGTLVGFAATGAMDRTVLPEASRRRIGTVLLIGVAMVPVVAIAGATASSRGLTGEVSHVWSRLTSTTPSSGVGNQPSRLGDLSNSRPLYWSEGLKVGEHSLLAGSGAGGFDTARTRYTKNPLAVAHAHSYAIETFADFGLIGIGLSLALLIAWATAARHTLRRVPGEADHSDERTAMFTMLAVVVTYGVSSAIDWTWFVPGVTVPALVCAGWLAGRGKQADAAPATGPAPPGTALAGTTAATSPTTAARAQRLPVGRLAAATGIVAAALIAGWFVWRPLHSADQVSAAIDAVSRGDTAAALSDARSAAASDPVSLDPLSALAAIYSATGDETASRAELVKATQVQPSNAQTWEQLGSFDLKAHRPRLALTELQTALKLDLTSQLTQQLIGEAQAQLTGAPPAQTGSA